jgi:hypothetical protein
LLANNGKSLSTSQITKSLNISPQIARRKMTEFKAIGLVDEEYTGSNHELSMKLVDKFNWFLGEEFNHIRDGFEPADYRKYLKEDITSEVADQPTPSSYQSAYERMIVFDRVFNELASEFEPSGMDDDQGTVGRYELQKRLVETGMFDQVDALVIIDEMIRIKKIKIVMVNTYRSTSKEDTSQ